MAWFGRRQARSATTPQLDSPSKHHFLWMRGRRHLAGMPYMLPNDLAEINRLDFQHFMLRYALRGNYLAPLSHPLSILDVGCGTGRWAMEMAAQFPEANVVGVDLVPPSFEQLSSVGYGLQQRPENYTFVPGNVFEHLPFADGTFDFVHQRLLFAAIPRQGWPHVVTELIRVTRPGGWVELVEGNVGAQPGAMSPAEQAFTEWALTVTSKRQIDLQIGPRLPTFLQEAGLANIIMREVQIPIGKHGGHLGVMMQTDVQGVIQGLQGPILATGVTDAATFDATIQQWLAEADRYRSVWSIFVTCGQRAE